MLKSSRHQRNCQTPARISSGPLKHSTFYSDVLADVAALAPATCGPVDDVVGTAYGLELVQFLLILHVCADATALDSDSFSCAYFPCCWEMLEK